MVAHPARHLVDAAVQRVGIHITEEHAGALVAGAGISAGPKQDQPFEKRQFPNFAHSPTVAASLHPVAILVVR